MRNDVVKIFNNPEKVDSMGLLNGDDEKTKQLIKTRKTMAKLTSFCNMEGITYLDLISVLMYSFNDELLDTIEGKSKLDEMINSMRTMKIIEHCMDGVMASTVASISDISKQANLDCETLYFAVISSLLTSVHSTRNDGDFKKLEMFANEEMNKARHHDYKPKVDDDDDDDGSVEMTAEEMFQFLKSFME